MNTKAETAVPALSSIGIDIRKDVFNLVGFCRQGEDILRKKIKRLALAETFKKIPPCIIGMEACLNAHLSTPEQNQATAPA
jgi:transposase